MSSYSGGGAYTLVHLMHELMGVFKEKIPCRFMHSNGRRKFRYGIGFGFPVVVYMYETPVRATNLVVLLKGPQDIHTVQRDVI